LDQVPVADLHDLAAMKHSMFRALAVLHIALEASAWSLRAPSSPLEAIFLENRQWKSSQQLSGKKVLAEDLQFWGEMATGTGSELHRLAAMVGRHGSKGSKLAGLQVASHNAPAELEPTAALLDSLYEDSKKRIVKLNEHEALSKQRYLEHQDEDRSRMAAIESEFKVQQGQHLSATLEGSQTALKTHLEDEETFFKKYWVRVRERNKKQFHTCLKIQHGLMDRLKSMRDAYKQAATQQTALIQHSSFLDEALKVMAALDSELASWD